jgi:hypothetical protein
MSLLDLIDKKIIDQLNREAARKQKKQDAFNDWLMKQKAPMSGRAVKKYSKFKLKEMKEAGIKFVGVLGSPNPGESCEACLAMKGQKIEIEVATWLPLPDCDKNIANASLLLVNKTIL